MRTVTYAFTTYNCERSIQSAINSAICQDYTPSEFLVYDDASTDKTVDVVERCLSRVDVSCEIIVGKYNRGVGYARRSLVEKASSEYIAFFDDDDISLQGRISLQIRRILEYEIEYPMEEPPLCYCDRFIFCKSKEPLYCRSMSIDQTLVKDKQALLALLSCRPMPSIGIPGSSATCTLVCKVSTIKKVGNFDARLRRYEDLDIAVKAVKRGISLLNISESLVNQYYIQTPNKLKSYKYNIKLVAAHKSAYPTREDYRFACQYIILKNVIVQQRLMEGFTLLIKLFFFNPCLLILVATNSFGISRIGMGRVKWPMVRYD